MKKKEKNHKWRGAQKVHRRDTLKAEAAQAYHCIILPEGCPRIIGVGFA